MNIKNTVLSVIILLISAGCAPSKPQATNSAPARKDVMLNITSQAFKNSEAIPKKYSCDGENINPDLQISGVPENTKSLALIMDDPDVPKNLKPDGLFVHWVVFNMPAATALIPENQTPPGTQGANGRGNNSYTGPCPPDREHRYFFKLYALDTMLNLPAGAKKEDLEQAMQGHILEQAELMGTYNRK